MVEPCFPDGHSSSFDSIVLTKRHVFNSLYSVEHWSYLVAGSPSSGANDHFLHDMENENRVSTLITEDRIAEISSLFIHILKSDLKNHLFFRETARILLSQAT